MTRPPPGRRRALLPGLVATLCALPLEARGQAPTLDELRPPAAPALVLLGVAPSAVERPTSPKALAASLLSATQDGTVLPRDYALEVAPYWLTGHDSLTFERYYRPSLGQSVLQSLGLSVATASLPAPADSIPDGTALAVGARAFLVSGKASPDMDAQVKRLRRLQDQVNQAVNDVVLLTADAEGEPETGRADSLRRAAAARRHAVDSLDLLAKDVGRSISGLDAERVGWVVELAGGVVVDFPRDLVDSSDLARAGLWLTASYRIPDPAIDLVGVVRYLRDDRGGANQTVVDFGGRLVVHAELLAVSAEFVEHAGPPAAGGGVSPGYRLSGNLEYRLRQGVVLTATFGKDDAGGGSGSKLISQIGVSFGLGSPVVR